ncbi:MAG: outer membrane protein assembly factor BamB family protein [Candidatus Aminicenantales bacterium]
MKKQTVWILLGAMLALVPSCALFRSRPKPYPSGLILPVVEDATLPVGGLLVGRVEERGGTLFFATGDGVVRAVDGFGRKAAWKFETGRRPASGPSLGVENIYLVGEGDILHCLGPDGRERWSKSVGAKVRTPVVETADRIYFGTDAGLRSLDLAGGDAGRFQAGSAVGGGPLVIGRRVIYGDDEGNVRAADPEGRIIWTFRASGRVLPPFASDGKRVFFNTEKRDFYSLSAETGKPRWKTRLAGSILSEPVVRGGRLFALGTNNVLYCLKTGGGDILWWTNVPARSSFAPSVIGDKIVVATGSSRILVFDAQKGTGAGEYAAPRDLRSNAVWLEPFLAVAVRGQEADGETFFFLKKELGVRLSTEKPSPRPSGEEIAVTASAVGFYKPRFEFTIKSGETTEVTQKASESNTWAWFAEKEGTYLLGVKVVDEKHSLETEIPFVIARNETQKEKTS